MPAPLPPPSSSPSSSHPRTERRTKESTRNAGNNVRFIPSVSRSSGLDPGGDALTKYPIQEEYRDYIFEKLKVHHNKYPLRPATNPPRAQEEMEQSVLIMFRKLREGIVSSKRRDGFATEIYEASALLSINYHDLPQASPILWDIVNNVCPVAADSDGSNPPPYIDQRNGIVLLHLLDLLISHYPSQSAFYAALRSRRTVVASIRPHIRMYAAAVATAMRRANYHALHQLALPTNPLYIQAIEHYGPKHVLPLEHICSLEGLRERTLNLILRRLREVVREDAWRVVRTAYREVTIGTGEDTSPSKDARDEKGSRCLPMPTQTVLHSPTTVSLSLHPSDFPEKHQPRRSRSDSTSSTTTVRQRDVPRPPREPPSGAWLARTLLLDQDECTEEGACAWIASRAADETTRKVLSSSLSGQDPPSPRGTTKNVKWVLYRAKR